MIGDHPWLGCGPGNFKDAYTRYKLPTASEEIADPHNFLLEIWSTAGTPAALAFLAVLGCFAWSVAGNGKKREERRGKSEEGLGKRATGGRDTEGLAASAASSKVQIPNPPTPDAWLFVLAGGAAGFLLSLPLGMLSEAPPSPMAVLLGLPLAGIAVALLLGWIRDGRMPRLLPALGVAVLLVNLLAAGGISLPSVAGSLWLLMALGLCACECDETTSFSGRRHVGQEPENQADVPSAAKRRWALNQFWIWIALAVALALAITCYYTAYSPVLACQSQLRFSERQPSQAVAHLEAAAAADPWAAEPWRRLAALGFLVWRQSPTEDRYERFERAVDNLARQAPNSAATWAAIGDWYFQAAAATGRTGKRIAPGA